MSKKTTKKCFICKNENCLKKVGDVYVCQYGSCSTCRICGKELKSIQRGLYYGPGLCPKCLKNLTKSIRNRKHERIVFAGRKSAGSLSGQKARPYRLLERVRPDGLIDVVEVGFCQPRGVDDGGYTRIIQKRTVPAEQSLRNWWRKQHIPGGYKSQRITSYADDEYPDFWERRRQIDRIVFWLRAQGYACLISRNDRRFDIESHRETLAEEKARTWAERIDEELGESHQKKIESIDKRNKKLVGELEDFVDAGSFDSAGREIAEIIESVGRRVGE